jgi:chemotaxis protein MotB
MKPKYLENETRGRDRWMVSYMDVLTILLIFFISAAAGLPPKADPPPPAPPPSPAVVQVHVTPPPPVVAESALDEVQRKLMERGLDVHREERGVVISLPQGILFASGDDHITNEALPVIGKIANVIADLPNRLALIGHADAVPIHNHRFNSNWELSAARGLRLLEVLNGKYGIPESRLSVSSDGATRPVSSNETPDGRAVNRRVEIVILEEEKPVTPSPL